MDKFLKNLAHDARMFWLGWRTQYRAAAQLRGAYILQVIGMIINNLGLLFAWLFLFDHFGTINGWGAPEFIAMQGSNMLIFGIMLLFSSGIPELPRYIDHGSFDSFLTKPASVLAQVSSSAIEIATVGDILLGIVLLGGYMIFASVGLLAFAGFLLAIVIGVIILWCFTLMPFIIAFYLFDSDRIARAFSFAFLDTGIYPTGVLGNKIRLILLTVVPGLFIGVVPVDILRGLHWEYLLIGVVVASFWLTVTLRLFRRALRRYESANLVGAR